jgi:antitoxin Xre/MbcA/ParS-like protein
MALFYRGRGFAEAAPTSVGRRSDPEVRKRMSAPAMRSFLRIGKAWELSVDEQRGLLGWPAASTYYKYKAGEIGTLSYDMLTRISLLLGIYKALHILYPDDALANRWVRLPNSNPMFGGKPALSLMVDGGIDGLTQTRRLLDARRGGWN